MKILKNLKPFFYFTFFFLICQSLYPQQINQIPVSQSKQCSLLLTTKGPLPAEVLPEISDLPSFAEAMTRGMLLKPEQADLFEVYRALYFGDANTSVNNSNLKSVADILKKHPELEKPHFREQIIQSVQKSYAIPENLAKYVSSQTGVAGQTRSSLLQIDANIGFWKKLLGYEEQKVDETLSKDLQKLVKEKNKKRFQIYMDRFIISKENRDFLVSDKNDYLAKAKILFQVLNKLKQGFELKNRDTRAIRQAMVDLVATVGFGNQATQVLLKSKNGLDKVEGLRKILDERDSLAMDLGFAGHFQELLNSLKIDFVTGSTKNENVNQIIANFENEVLQGSFTALPTQSIRIRSLSIQEAPFRSCLGGSDCSTRTYFSKALDPNYNYFTMTDSNHQSSGHVTVVLGAARDVNGHNIQVAFIDKLQNVPNQMIPTFLEAVSKSLSEKGYKLVVPQDVGDHNGLSNMDTIRHFVDKGILPHLNEKLTGFVPNKHQYNFENAYSRAYNKLDVAVFKNVKIDPNVQIQSGLDYAARPAPENLNKTQLIQDLLKLRDSHNEQDIMKYVSSGSVISQLDKLGLYSQAQFQKDLSLIVKDQSHSFAIRKQAVFEYLLGSQMSTEIISKITTEFGLIKNFSDTEITQVSSEIKQWIKASDKRKKAFAEGLSAKWFLASQEGEVNQLKVLQELKLMDINHKNASGKTALMVAVDNRQVKSYEFLLTNPHVNLYEVDSKGFTVFDHAANYDNQEFLEEVRRRRTDVEIKIHPQVFSHLNQPMLFNRVEAGSFLMGEEKIPTTISKPFELMATPVTQKQWAMIMGENPSHFKEGEETVTMQLNNQPIRLQPDNPVETVNYEDVQGFIKKINLLSKNGDPALEKIILGHKKGDIYRLPTEAETEFVMTDRGNVTTAFYHGADESPLGDYAWYSANSNNTTHPVAQKKPIIVNGQKFYDLQGNVWEWNQDWYGNLSGGTDPQGPRSGSYRVIRGGGWRNLARGLRSARRNFSDASYRFNVVGFRLVRTH